MSSKPKKKPVDTVIDDISEASEPQKEEVYDGNLQEIRENDDETPQIEEKTVENDEKIEEIVENDTKSIENDGKTVENDEKIEEKQPEMDVMAMLKATLKAPIGRNGLHTLATYDLGANFRRYAFLDLDGESFQEAWERYKAMTGSKDSQDFLLKVFTAMDMDMPRLHRNVQFVKLD